MAVVRTNRWSARVRLFLSSRRRVSRSRYRLNKAVIEALEARTLLTTYTVTTTADSGTGSLRQAIIAANAAGGTNQINFSGVSGTIALVSVLPGLNNNITIHGPGANVLTVNGESHGSVFVIESSVGADIDNLKITGGSSTSQAGGITNNGGNLTVDNCTISGNTGVRGGGIYNASHSTINVSNSTISGNSATYAGGGIYNSGYIT